MASQADPYPRSFQTAGRPQQQSPPVSYYQSPPVQQQQQQQQKPPSRPRGFSFRSEKSRQSFSNKTDLHETHAEKETRRLHSKADPTLAMNEAEPSMVATMSHAALAAPLRSMQHKDSHGNIIAEPDLSNPTRNRWERPLDTIRSFESAIDGNYSRRHSYRTDTDPAANWNRRTSYNTANQPRFPQESYYGSRAASIRGDGSQWGTMAPNTTRNSYYDSQNMNGGYSTGYGPVSSRHPSRERTPRIHPEAYYKPRGRDQNIYPLPHKDRSYETVASAAASGNSDPAGYQTDPTSSDNSSIRRTSPAKRAEPVNDYGIGFSQAQAYQSSNLSAGLKAPGGHPLPTPPRDAYYQNSQPIVPRKEIAVLRRQPVPQQQPIQQQQVVPEKRKSWFARRFSKNS